jgi:hypothetical protein
MDCRVKPGNDEREAAVVCLISRRTPAFRFWGLPSPTETR